MNIMYNINKSRVTLLIRLKSYHPDIAELKYSCDYGTNNYNPICPDINSELSHATEGPCAYLKK
jgi:hypothetical protein